MAKFAIGNPGKAKGTLNKRSREFIAVLEKHKFCTASAMLDLYKVSLQRFTEDLAKEDSGRISPMESNAHKYAKLCADLLQALASYAYPKLKAIEHNQGNPLDGMTPEQKLRAAEATVEVMKLQVHGPQPRDL